MNSQSNPIEKTDRTHPLKQEGGTMKKLAGGAILLGLIATLSVVAIAQTNNIPYEGRLTAASGARLGQDTATITFSVYDAVSVGTLLWGPETHDVVPLDNGVFNVQLGTFVALPAALFDGSDRYLEIQVRGEVLTPRQPIGSVPHARLAATVPAGVIGSTEITNNSVRDFDIFDEPGIAQNRNTSSISISSDVTMTDLATVTITIPAAGYIFVVGRGLAEIVGTTSANGIAAQIDETAGGGLIAGRFSLFSMSPPPSTGFVDGDISAQQTYFKAAGTYTFRLEGMSYFVPAGSRTVYFPVVTATYYPTAYGGVITVASSPVEFPNGTAKTVKVEMPNGLESTETIYQADLQELGLRAKETEQAKQATELEAGLQKAKEQLRQNQQPKDDR